MKKIISIILLSFTMISFAQHRDDVKERKMKLTTEQQAILRTKQMVLELDLNTSQQKQLLSLNQKQAQQKEKIMTQRKAMRASEEKPSQDAIFKMKEEMMDQRIALQTEVKKILNEQQYEQWRNSYKKMHKKHKEHRERSKTKHRS